MRLKCFSFSGVTGRYPLILSSRTLQMTLKNKLKSIVDTHFCPGIALISGNKSELSGTRTTFVATEMGLKCDV